MKRWIALTAAVAVACSPIVMGSPVQAKQPDLPGDPDIHALCEFLIDEYGGFNSFGDCISGFRSNAPEICKELRSADLLEWAGFDSFSYCVRTVNNGSSQRR
ncbi:hypothetical protein OMW55_11280 [Sphingomonas sp. BN140010]|uniref:Uncharacterized protein n=1 Tax=Sphingomonas arvum TaxID=2992113 RepID=A0ABT3JHY1_9SPHN|nr:hypothetical protein [Sphingomonas sp. BN140010]MCW3798386.1 hypothetical protein [Sphingomonas sp. BN140010]